MKNLTRVCLVLLVLTTTTLSATAKAIFKYSDSKKIERSFSVGENPTIKLDEIYGDVIFVEGESGKVDITVSIEMKTNDKEYLEESMNRYVVEFENGSNSVSITGKFTEEKKRFFGSIKQKSRNQTILYTIKAPKHYIPELKVKYGDITLTDIYSGGDFNIRYGELKANSINGGASTIGLHYSDMTANNLEQATVEMSYGEMELGVVQNVEINNRYSEIIIKEATQFSMPNVSYGDIEIGSIDNLTMELCRYTDFKIGTITGSFKCSKIDYGDLYIDSANSILIGHSRYTDITIGNLDNSFSCDAEYLELTLSASNSLKKIYMGSTRYADVVLKLPQSLPFEAKTKGRYLDLNFSDSFEAYTPAMPYKKGSSSSNTKNVVVTGGPKSETKAAIEIYGDYLDLYINKRL